MVYLVFFALYWVSTLVCTNVVVKTFDVFGYFGLRFDVY